MYFVLELRTRDYRTFRLQEDGTWRFCEAPEALLDSDYKTASAAEIIRTQTDRMPVNLDGAEYRVHPDYINYFEDDDVAFYSTRVFRKEFPPVPNIDQLRNAIRDGDDDHHNSLILNV